MRQDVEQRLLDPRRRWSKRAPLGRFKAPTAGASTDDTHGFSTLRLKPRPWPAARAQDSAPTGVLEGATDLPVGLHHDRCYYDAAMVNAMLSSMFVNTNRFQEPILGRFLTWLARYGGAVKGVEKLK